MTSLLTAGPILCLVTSTRRLAGQTGMSPAAAVPRLVSLVHEAMDAGVDLVHIRERDFPDRDLLALVEAILVNRRGPARVVVNDRIDVALAAGADGVHLRADGIEPEHARRLGGGAFLIGRSTHDLHEVRAAAGADYIVFGPIFATRSKRAGSPVAGVEALAAAARAASRPVLAIGGIDLETAGQAGQAGAAGVAAIDVFLPEHASGLSLGDRVAALRRALQSSV